MPWDYALVTLFHNVADISGPFKMEDVVVPRNLKLSTQSTVWSMVARG